MFDIQTLSYRNLTPHSSPLVRTLLQRGKFLQQELSPLCLSNAILKSFPTCRSFSLILKILSVRTLKYIENNSNFCQSEWNFVSQNLRTDTFQELWCILGDSLGVYRWPQCRYKRRFYKSHSRLLKITTGNRCRNIRTMQNVTNRNLIDPYKSGTWGKKSDFS